MAGLLLIAVHFPLQMVPAHLMMPRTHSSAYRGPDGSLIQYPPVVVSPPRRRTASAAKQASTTDTPGDDPTISASKPSSKKTLSRSSSSNHSQSPASLPATGAESLHKVFATADAGLPGVKWALISDNKERDPWDNVVSGLPERTVTLPIAPMYPTMVPVQHQQAFNMPHWAVPKPTVTSPTDNEVSPSSKHTEIFY